MFRNHKANSKKYFTSLIDLRKTDEINLLGDSRNYMSYGLVPSSAKLITTQILVIAKLNERKDFNLRGFVCELLQGITCSKLVA